MSAEVIDIFIIAVVFLACLIFIMQKVRGAMNRKEGDGCSGCGSSKSCSTEEKQNCQTHDVLR